MKKETFEENCTCTDECLGYLTKTCKGIEEEPKQELRGIPKGTINMVIGKPKQETLEEAAIRFYKESKLGNVTQSFIEGAKWQQEQDKNKYSEEELRDMLQSYVEWAINGYGTYYDWFEQFKKK